MPFCDKDKTTAVHNRWRERHGAPPLQWSRECAIHAQKCADENQAHGRVHHCFVETAATHRRMGQAIYWSGEASKVTSAVAVACWYEECKDPGYDFSKPGYQPGTGQFTSLVWYNTTHVGMARSANGNYIVANYYPAGNIVGEKSFLMNVLPSGTPLSLRPRNKVEAELFRSFESISKGRMSVPTEELGELFRRMGNKRLELAAETADVDGDGFVDPREFAMAMSHERDSDGENEGLSRIIGFVQADDNGDSRVDVKELQRFMNSQMGMKVTEERAKEILAKYDADGDGTLDYGELSELLTSNARRGATQNDHAAETAAVLQENEAKHHHKHHKAEADTTSGSSRSCLKKQHSVHEEEPHSCLKKKNHNHEEEPHSALKKHHGHEEEPHSALKKPHGHEEEPHNALKKQHSSHEREPHSALKKQQSSHDEEHHGCLKKQPSSHESEPQSCLKKRENKSETREREPESCLKKESAKPTSDPTPPENPKDDNADVVCVCGNTFTPGCNFCRKCGTKRPEAVVEGAREQLHRRPSTPGPKGPKKQFKRMNTGFKSEEEVSHFTPHEDEHLKPGETHDDLMAVSLEDFDDRTEASVKQEPQPEPEASNAGSPPKRCLKRQGTGAIKGGIKCADEDGGHEVGQRCLKRQGTGAIRGGIKCADEEEAVASPAKDNSIQKNTVEDEDSKSRPRLLRRGTGAVTGEMNVKDEDEEREEISRPSSRNQTKRGTAAVTGQYNFKDEDTGRPSSRLDNKRGTAAIMGQYNFRDEEDFERPQSTDRPSSRQNNDRPSSRQGTRRGTAAVSGQYNFKDEEEEEAPKNPRRPAKRTETPFVEKCNMEDEEASKSTRPKIKRAGTGFVENNSMRDEEDLPISAPSRKDDLKPLSTPRDRPVSPEPERIVGGRKKLAPIERKAETPEVTSWATTRDSSKKMQTMTAKVWSDELERLFEDLPPLAGVISISVRQCLRSGGTAEVSRMPKSIEVRLTVGGSSGNLSWEWQ